MKKTNKILARVLVIILSLVLITSSVVSSTFAKYVVVKTGKTTVGMEAFGLDVTITAKHDSTPSETAKNGDSVTLTFTNLLLKPGDVIDDAVNVKVSGEAKCAVNVVIDVTVAYNGGAFVVNKSHFSSLGNADPSVYVPIAFTVEGAEATTSYNNLPATDAASAIETAIQNEVTGSSIVNGKVTKNYPMSGGKVIIGSGDFDIDFGFKWTNDGDLLHDQIGTYLANQTDSNKSTVTISYTISVEQDTSSN